MKSQYSITNLVFAFLGGWVLLFILAPIAGMFLKTEGVLLIETAADKEVINSIWLTIWISMLTTLVFAIFAIPLAYLMARRNFVGKRLISGLIDLPVVIPHSAAGIALLGFISSGSMLGKTAGFLGFDMVSNTPGIALAMAFVSVPFLVNAARDGFEAVPVRLEKASLSLGASNMQTFFKISLPLAGRSIVSGLIMMFARGMSEFGAIVIIAYHPMVTPVLIFERFSSFGLSYARPVAVIFVCICLAFFILIRFLTKKDKHATP